MAIRCAFLEDETRFFQKILDRVFEGFVESDPNHDMQQLSLGLYKLEERRNYLKSFIERQQILLESLLEDNRITVIPDLMDENAKMAMEIKNLFILDRLIKKELFEMVEEIIGKENRDPSLQSALT